MIVRLFAVLTASALLSAFAVPTLAQPARGRTLAAATFAPAAPGGPATPAAPGATIGPTPPSIPSSLGTPAETTPPTAAPGSTAAPPNASPAGDIERFTGQLLDVRSGYVYFTTGDAFKLAAEPRIDDYDTGKPTQTRPGAKMFARAIFDPASKQVVELDVTTRRLPQDTAYAPAAQAMSANKAVIERAPEIVGVPVTGKEVAVAFVVTVPATTGLNADVYISTDASGWNPQAIRMDRIDGRRYRATRRFASGTKFAFRVTRGSWNAVEVGEDGLEAPPHQYFTKEVDAQEAAVTVYAWSDNKTGSPSVAQPGAIPTPYNPNPFAPGQYPRGGPTPTYPMPTQRPANPFPNVPH